MTFLGTGDDHLLFLFGVISFLYRMKDIGIYVKLFAVGHSWRSCSNRLIANLSAIF